MQKYCFVLIPIFLTLFSTIAQARPFYEKVDRIIEANDGKRITLARSYADGSTEINSVQLIVYDENGTLLETGFGRDVVVFCKETNDCFVFLYAGALSIVPDEMYEIKGREVANGGKLWIVLYGIIAPFTQNPIRYLLAVILFLLLAKLLSYKTRKRFKTNCLKKGYLGIPCIIAWIWFVYNSCILVPLLVILIAITSSVLDGIYKIIGRFKSPVNKIKEHGLIHVELQSFGNAFELFAKDFDTETDVENWETLRTSIPAIAFSNRSIIVTQAEPPKWSIVSDLFQRDKLPFIKKAIDGIEFVIVKVNSVKKEVLEEIGIEEGFWHDGNLWIIVDGNMDTSAINKLYELRNKYPCETEKWYACETEFMLCDGDGCLVIWNRPNMDANEYVNEIRTFCLKKNIGVDIEIVDTSLKKLYLNR